MPEAGRKQALADICFGRWRLSPASRRLLVDDTPVALGGRAFDVLLALVEARGEIVTKEALMRRVWPGTIIEDNNLQVQIAALRKALGRDADLLITTVPRRGYCFTCKWQWQQAAPSAEAAGDAPTTLTDRPSPIVLPFHSLGSEIGGLVNSTPPRPPTGRPVVLVLPFNCIGGEAEQTYFMLPRCLGWIETSCPCLCILRFLLGAVSQFGLTGAVSPSRPDVSKAPRAAAVNDGRRPSRLRGA